MKVRRILLVSIALLSSSGFAEERHVIGGADPHAQLNRQVLVGKKDPARLARTALGEFIESNGGKYPKSLPELRELLDKVYGPSDTVIVPFSGAPNYTDLDESRLVYMSAAHDLYIAAIKRLDGTIDMEFISRNKDKKHVMDFGVVRDFGGKNPDAEFVDSSGCITCHKNGGPAYFGQPWNNTLSRISVVEQKTIKKEFPGTLRDNFSDINQNVALHTVFLERLAKREKEYEDLAKAARAHYEMNAHTSQEKEVPNFLVVAQGRRWNGADIVGNPSKIEGNVFAGNQISALHEITKKMAPEVKHRFISYLVFATVCDTPVFSSPAATGFGNILLNELLTYRRNSPVLANSLNLGHLAPDSSKPLVQSPLTDVASVLSYQEKKQKGGLPNTDPDDSAIHVENLVSSALPIMGTNSYFDETGNRIRDAYGRSLRLKGKLKKFCDSEQYDKLVSAEALPGAEEVAKAIEEWKKNPTQPNRTKIKTCMECHDGGSNAPKFSFDVSSLEDWKAAFANEKLKGAANKWLAPILRSLKKNTMPPEPFESHQTDVERATLIQYLEGITAKKK